VHKAPRVLRCQLILPEVYYFVSRQIDGLDLRRQKNKVDDVCGGNEPQVAMPALVERLRWRAEHQADAIAYEFVSSDGVEVLTYGELAHRVVAVAALLSQAEVERRRPPDRQCPVLILSPPGLDYVVALWACIVANLPAVPAYPPASERSLGRLGRLVTESDAKLVLVHSWSAASIKESTEVGLSECRVLPIESADRESVRGFSEFLPAAHDDVAIIQYTSGSTGAPRGVVLTQRNIMNNVHAIVRLFELDHDSRAFVWLPPYHDMGLIGGIITPAYVGFPVRMMSPFDFLKNPSSWLLQLSETQTTVSGGPNFGYDLVTRKFRDEARHMDLSNWRVAFNGAETVRRTTMDEFTRRFSRYGFRSESFLPCYGLAEATLLVAGGHLRPETSQRGRVSCGSAVSDCDIAIVDMGTGRPVGDGVEGEIWLRGPSVSPGYWREAAAFGREATGDLDGLRYLRTGDLGWLSNGELYVNGRANDLLIRRGRNYFAQDLEDAATDGEARLRRIAAAFAVEQDNADCQIVLIVEQVGEVSATGGVAPAVRARVMEETGLGPDVVIVVPARTIPRTSSGKTQRALCRERYLAGAYDQWLSANESSPAVASDLGELSDNDAQLPDLAALLAGVFEAVCETEFSENVSLAEMGGDSIMAAEIASIVGESADLLVPIDAVLTEPTPLGLARWLLGAWRAKGQDPQLAIDRMAAVATREGRP
jgi:acyl-CoA synthetase (AMP-forming)/AMP-acid ligase II